MKGPFRAPGYGSEEYAARKGLSEMFPAEERFERPDLRILGKRITAGTPTPQVGLPFEVVFPFTASPYDDARPACAEVEDPDLFFSEQPSKRAEARQVCLRCPRREACLDASLGGGASHGTWGGLTEIERLSLRRSRKGRPPAVARQSLLTITETDDAKQRRAKLASAAQADFGLSL